MKKVREEIVRKDSSVNKVQFDKEWFYSIKDIEDYLNEKLPTVEYIHLPMVIEGEQYTVKCATWEDIERARVKEPLEDFKGSVLRKKNPAPKRGGKK
jgi:hypothetical protein